MTSRRPRCATALLVTGLSATLGLVAAPAARAGWDADPALDVGVSIWPQLEQHVGDAAVFAETIDVGVLLSAGRRTRVGIEVQARPDFVVVGAAWHRDLSVSSRREWRLHAGMGYTIPVDETEPLFERLNGQGSSTVDRLHLDVGLGQTFGVRGALGFRVGYRARLMLPGSLLSTLEALDDEIVSDETFVMHAFQVGIELRRGAD